MKAINKIHLEISIVIAMLNSETTIIKTLESVLGQLYPVREIIVVDNGSNDGSMKLVTDFAKRNKKIKIQVIQREKNMGVGGSYNFGVEKSISPYVIFMHSDGVLQTKDEIQKLVSPLVKDKSVVASYSSILLPFTIWKKYPFWEKCLLTRSVGEVRPGLNGKFDCVNKRLFQSIGGFDDERYGHDIGIGGEDGDLLKRLQLIGTVVKSEATVIHLHDLRHDYSFQDWIINRKLLARSYGRFIRIHGLDISQGGWQFLVKPIMAFLSPILLYFPWAFIIYVLFAIYYMKNMYLVRDSVLNWRIYILPFLTIGLIYYETIWMIESFVSLSFSDYNKTI